MEPDDGYDDRALLEDILSVIRPIITSLTILEEALGDEIDALPAPNATSRLQSRLQLVKARPGAREEADDV